jgi:hypothetical protein
MAVSPGRADGPAHDPQAAVDFFFQLVLAMSGVGGFDGQVVTGDHGHVLYAFLLGVTDERLPGRSQVILRTAR